jgi:hypothetical protein
LVGQEKSGSPTSTSNTDMAGSPPNAAPGSELSPS